MPFFDSLIQNFIKSTEEVLHGDGRHQDDHVRVPSCSRPSSEATYHPVGICSLLMQFSSPRENMRPTPCCFENDMLLESEWRMTQSSSASRFIYAARWHPGPFGLTHLGNDQSFIQFIKGKSFFVHEDGNHRKFPSLLPTFRTFGQKSTKNTMPCVRRRFIQSSNSRPNIDG